MSSKSSLRNSVYRHTPSDPYRYETQDLTEVNTERMALTSSASPRMVQVCTMCGRYKGLRSVPKSSRRSFYIEPGEKYFTKDFKQKLQYNKMSKFPK